jgi:competence protein ComEC
MESWQCFIDMHENGFFEALARVAEEGAALFWTVVLSLAVFCVYGFSSLAADASGEYFLSVGQGDAQAVVFPAGSVALIDGGPPNGRAVSEIQRVLPFWKRSIEVIFASHPDTDHIGGLTEIIRRYRVGIVFTNGDASESGEFQEFKQAIADRNVVEMPLRKGDVIRIGGMSFRVLWPSGEAANGNDEGNDKSLVLLLESGARTTLYTGDASEKIERTVASGIGPVDILKVGHHGSKYSTGEALLLSTRPRAAIIGVGKNRYGHPAPEVLSRLQAFGIPAFRTDRDGSMRVPFGADMRILAAD